MDGEIRAGYYSNAVVVVDIFSTCYDTFLIVMCASYFAKCTNRTDMLVTV